jgi:hypothetical protein
MRIEQVHGLGRQEAITRVDALLDRLIRDPPGGVTVKNPRKEWDGHRMVFSFTMSRGFFGTSFHGSMDVLDDRVVVESELPPVVKGLVGEERVRHAISGELAKLLK